MNSFPTYDSTRTDYGRFPRGIQAVVPQYQFPCTGVVRQLTARVGIGDVDGIFAVEIWRPTDINGSYTLLWEMQHPTIETYRIGNMVTFSPSFAVPVERGDVIGFYSGSPYPESHQILYDTTARGVTVYSTSGGDGPLCNFSICDVSVFSQDNTAPLISATYGECVVGMHELREREICVAYTSAFICKLQHSTNLLQTNSTYNSASTCTPNTSPCTPSH